jgi:hypothetical protein
MHPSFSTLARAVAAAVLIAIAAGPASAACTKLGFTVNDFGKDGPTKDAKGLLDKYIAKWATDHKIAKYHTGPKDVKCELFLNLIVVDEHTCRAEATVCWDGAPVTPAVKAEGPPDAKPAIAPKAPAIKRAAVPAPSPAPPALAPVKPASKAAATPVVRPIETGTLPAVVTPVVPAAGAIEPPAAVPAPAATQIAPPAAPKAAAAEPAVADQALAAAQKAAAAAERAAAAAERAAAAAQAAEKGNAAKP